MKPNTWPHVEVDLRQVGVRSRVKINGEEWTSLTHFALQTGVDAITSVTMTYYATVGGTIPTEVGTFEAIPHDPFAKPLYR